MAESRHAGHGNEPPCCEMHTIQESQKPGESRILYAATRLLQPPKMMHDVSFVSFTWVMPRNVVQLLYRSVSRHQMASEPFHLAGLLLGHICAAFL